MAHASFLDPADASLDYTNEATIFGTDGGSEVSETDFDTLLESSVVSETGELEALDQEVLSRLAWFEKNGFSAPPDIANEWQRLHSQLPSLQHASQMEVDIPNLTNVWEPTLNLEQDRFQLENEYKTLKSKIKSIRDDIRYSGNSQHSIALIAYRKEYLQAPRAPPAVEPLDSDNSQDWDPPSNAALSIGPIKWGHDLEGEIRALMDLLPNGYSGERKIKAGRMGRKGFVVVAFTSYEDALQFHQSWIASPPRGFEGAKTELVDLGAIGQEDPYSDESEEEEESGDYYSDGEDELTQRW